MTIDIFICRRMQRTPCYRCSSDAVKRCDGPGQAPGEACDRPLCPDHARGTRCAQHAPEQVHPAMPRPPRRP